MAGGGLCRQLPRERQHRLHRSQGGGADILFRAAQDLRRVADPCDDPHGRCQHRHAMGVQFLHGTGQARRPCPAGRQTRGHVGPDQVPDRRCPHLWSASQQSWILAGAGGLHGGRGDRSGSLQFLSLYRHQSQAVVWFHRNGRLRVPAPGQGRAIGHGGHSLRRRADQDRRERRGARQDARTAQGVLQEPGSDGGSHLGRWLVSHQRCRLP